MKPRISYVYSKTNSGDLVITKMADDTGVHTLVLPSFFVEGLRQYLAKSDTDDKEPTMRVVQR